MSKTLICKCDRCGLVVNEKNLLSVPNPGYVGNIYYSERVPYSVTPVSWELCMPCVEDLISIIRDYCCGASVSDCPKKDTYTKQTLNALYGAAAAELHPEYFDTDSVTGGAEQ